MNIIKKICIIFTVMLSITVFSAASITASADEKALSPADTAPYTVMMCINADKELWEQKNDNAEAVSFDGDYSVAYDFQTGASSITALVLDTNIDAASMPGVVITVNRIYIDKSDGSSAEVPYDASKAVQTKNKNGCHRLNILYSFGTDAAKAIDTNFPEKATMYDKLVIDFTISGIAASPDNAAVTTAADGADTDAVSGTAVETASVSQTADTGVAAIAVTGAAAVSLAAAAVTVKKKRK